MQTITNKFPVLFDVTIDGKTTAGFFNYETDIFDIPEKKLTIIAKHFPEDMRIIESVGYRVL